MRAEKRRRARRAFFKGAALTASVAAITLSAVVSFRRVSESRTPSGVKSEISREMSFLDGQYAKFGRQKIEDIVFKGPDQLAMTALSWIQRNDHRNLYDILCGALMGPTPRLRKHAGVLLHGVKPALLKPHLQTILAARAGLKSALLGQLVDRLIVKIERA